MWFVCVVVSRINNLKKKSYWFIWMACPSILRSLIDVYHNEVRTTFNCSCICFILHMRKTTKSVPCFSLDLLLWSDFKRHVSINGWRVCVYVALLIWFSFPPLPAARKNRLMSVRLWFIRGLQISRVCQNCATALFWVHIIVENMCLKKM